MSSLLARKGVTYLLVVAVLAGFAIFIGHHEPTRRVTWDFIMPVSVFLRLNYLAE